MVVDGYRRAINFPVGPIVTGVGSEPVLLATDGSKEYPVILKRKYGNVDVYAVCLGSYPGLFLQYPEVVRQALRDIAARYIGINVAARSGYTSNISIYPYKGEGILFSNFNNYGVLLDVAIDRDKTGFGGWPKVRLGDAEITEVRGESGTDFTLRIPGRSYALVSF